MSGKTSKTSTGRKTATSRASTNRLNGTAAGGSRAPTAAASYAASRTQGGAASATPTVRCTLAPLGNEFLLLPTNVIAEVIEFTQPDPSRSSPEWFLGQIEWQNRQIPVFSFAALIGGSQPGEITSRARVMIVKSLTDSARMPYLGILISDIPKLVTVEPEHLVHTGDEKKSLGVFCHVTVHDQPALIPDLERLTHLVTHAAYGVLPITQSS